MSPATDLTCRELVELVTDRLEDALPDAERRRVDAHLGECDGCATYVAQVRATIEAVGRLPPAALPPAVRRRLRAAFRARTGTGPA